MNLRPPIISFFLIIGFFETIDKVFLIPEVILPAPHEIFQSIYQNFSNLMYHTSITIIESIGGFIIGSALSFAVALAFIYCRPLQNALYPYAIALKATPLYVFAPLLVLWFGNGMLPKTLMAAIIAFFPVLVNAVNGLSSIPRDSLLLFQMLNASSIQVLFKLRIPYALSYIFPGLKIASTLSIVGAIFAEFTGATKGIGFVIINASYYLDTSLMFAAIIMTGISGVLLFYGIEYLERKILFWK